MLASSSQDSCTGYDHHTAAKRLNPPWGVFPLFSNIIPLITPHGWNSIAWHFNYPHSDSASIICRSFGNLKSQGNSLFLKVYSQFLVEVIITYYVAQQALYQKGFCSMDPKEKELQQVTIIICCLERVKVWFLTKNLIVKHDLNPTSELFHIFIGCLMDSYGYVL